MSDNDFYQYDEYNTFDGITYLFPYEIEDWYDSDVFYETLKYEDSDLKLNYIPIVNYPVDPQDEHYELIIHPADLDFQHNSYDFLEQLLNNNQFDDAFLLIKNNQDFYQSRAEENFDYALYFLTKGYEHIVLYMLENRMLHLNYRLFFSAVNNNSQNVVQYIYQHAPQVIYDDIEKICSSKISNIFHLTLALNKFSMASLLLKLGYSFDNICLSDLLSVNVSPNDTHCYDKITEREAGIITFLYEHLPDKNRLSYFIQDCLRPPLKEYFKQFLFNYKLCQELPEGQKHLTIKI